ncbi:SDR family NAD(P)-dependent oxidoreductase [Chelatococcus reniformis]|uniref:Oxidoreductase n=1 Tax=Chelatococcus reniformis TaxID=1494448 RepID=A0A916UHF0_9HYPH|nr:SDR family oxidoreductase [Chelatococcus reniformis]GGC72943.1 oxidoreductase [Chelatococcus reniformis]
MGVEGLTILVTGAASGLGAASAVMLAERGAARLLLNYASSREAAEATAETCRKAGAEVRVVQGDVAEDADCRRIVGEAAAWGHLDGLVNNAGTTLHVAHGNLDGLSAADFQRIYAVNTIGPYQMIRAARGLLEEGGRRLQAPAGVVNVSSIAGISGIGSSIAYVGSKAALNGITLSLARALAPLIRVNALCPGYMDTPWFVKGTGQQAADQLREGVRATMPLQAAPTPEDVAEAVVFLVGTGSRYMTGEIVPYDAGARLVGPGPRRGANA